MKIAMIGSGAAGSVFASYLRAGGADMWLVDRYKAHMDKVAAEGMRFITPSGERLLTGFRTAYSADAIGEMDIVILMVKATQTEAIMPSVSPCIGENTVVVSLQNGLDNDRILSAFLPAERIICGFGIIGTELREPGVCAAKPEEGILMRFGACKKSYLSDAAGEYLEAAFTRGGCPARYEPDIWPFIWKKAISNSGYNTVSAILGLKVGQVLANEHGRKLILDVWREGCAVAKAAGMGDLWPETEASLPMLASGFSDYYPSMAQDMLLHRRQTEIRHLNGAIADYGDRLGVPSPLNRMLTELVSCEQENYDVVYVKKP